MKNGGLRALAKGIIEIPPSIQVFSNKQAIVQGAQGIVEYTAELIRLSYAGGEARFYGQALSIGCLSKEGLEITGRIERLEYA